MWDVHNGLAWPGGSGGVLYVRVSISIVIWTKLSTDMRVRTVILDPPEERANVRINYQIIGQIWSVIVILVVQEEGRCDEMRLACHKAGLMHHVIVETREK